jgi:hypothetical protein
MKSKFMIAPDETLIDSDILHTGSRATSFEVAQRISWLTENYLEKVFDAGWEALYRDPSGNRLLEKTFPKSEMHGGGPVILRQINEEDARVKYAVEKIKPHETEIGGNSDSNMLGVKIAYRIYCLTHNYLEKISVSDSGLEELYKDPTDKRYWELMYYNNGIPYKLKFIKKENVLKKYGIVNLI